MYEPDKELADYTPNVRQFVGAIANADGLLISTAAYHGTLAGVTKNALDYLEFLSDTEYLHNKPVGLIATAGGDQADVNSIACRPFPARNGTAALGTDSQCWQGL